VLLAKALVLLPATVLGLRAFGFIRAQKILGGTAPFAKAGACGVDNTLLVARTARMVGVAARYGFWRANCLQQSLTLWRLLRQQGVTCELRIGVRRESARLKAHAWVEYRGVPVNDTHDVRERFAAFGHDFVPIS